MPQTGLSARPAAKAQALAIARWLVLAAVLIVLPLVFSDRSAITTFNYIGIMAVFALSFNVLLGQTGLLSLGHGIYYGLGGFFALHAFMALANAGVNFPLPLVPLFGAVAAGLFGALFGFIASGRGGMAYAMITLGLGELVHAISFILPSFFGGEEGKEIDRTTLGPFLGIDFSQPIHVYYVIAAWLLLTALALAFIARTPFGLLSNAVRDNSERVEFIGFKPSRVRTIASIIAAAFAGLAGGLGALNFEVMTTHDLGAEQSTLVLLMTYIGGIGQLFGPVIGVAVIGSMKIWLSDITPAWQLYFGLLFIFVVMFVPDGLAGVLRSGWTLARSRHLGRLLPSGLGCFMAALVFVLGLSLLIELAYRAGIAADKGPVLAYFGLALDVHAVWTWIAALVLAVLGFMAMRRASLRFAELRDELELKAAKEGSQ